MAGINLVLTAEAVLKTLDLRFQELSLGFQEPDEIIVRGRFDLPFKGRVLRVLIKCRVSLSGRTVLQGVVESDAAAGIMIGFDKTSFLVGLLGGIPVKGHYFFGIMALQKNIEWTPVITSVCVSGLSVDRIIPLLTDIEKNDLGWLNIFEITDFEINPDEDFFNHNFHVKQLDEDSSLFTDIFALRHYKVTRNASGIKVSLPPQLYINMLEKEVDFGEYSLSPGIFFCAALIILGIRQRLLFSLNHNEVEAFCKLEPISLRFIKIMDAGDYVPDLTENDMLKQYDTVDKKGATFYLRLTDKIQQVYIYADIELLGLFRFNTKILYHNGLISINYLYKQLAGLGNVCLSLQANNEDFINRRFMLELKIDAANFDMSSYDWRTDFADTTNITDFITYSAETNDEISRLAGVIGVMRGESCWDAAFCYFLIGSQERYETGLRITGGIVSEVLCFACSTDADTRRKLSNALKQLLYISGVNIKLECQASRWEANLHLEYVFIGRLRSKDIKFSFSMSGLADFLKNKIFQAIDFVAHRKMTAKDDFQRMVPGLDMYGEFLSEQQAAIEKQQAALILNNNTYKQLYGNERPAFEGHANESLILEGRQAVQNKAILGFVKALKEIDIDDEFNVKLAGIEKAIKAPGRPQCDMYSHCFLDLEQEPVFINISKQLYGCAAYRQSTKSSEYKPRVKPRAEA